MRTTVLITVGAAVALLLLFGCPNKQPPAPSQQPAAPTTSLPPLPLELSVKQRTTTPLATDGGGPTITIDDVTRGQAMVSLALDSGRPLLAPTSLREGESASFELEGRTYAVTLKKLTNELVGEDSAVIVVDEQASAATTPKGDAPDPPNDDEPVKNGDAARIRAIIEHVRTLEGAVFIRNGQEHTPADAADHLQRKWQAATGRITTVAQFIDELATRSSTTGEAYVIRFADGSEQPAGPYLREQLAGLQ